LTPEIYAGNVSNIFDEGVKKMSQEVKARMVRKKISQALIANKLELTPGTVSAVVNGKRKSKRVQEAIAEELGVKYETLWGRPA
jgi:transcriptional regulator with XRE-family HTH domain